MSTLLGETVAESEADEVKALSEKLEIINLQFAEKGRAAGGPPLAAHRGVRGHPGRRRGSAAVNSPYLGWDYSAPETAVMGVAIHAFEWVLCPSGALLL